MSHFIYSTEAIILGEMLQGEDSRLYFLLTEKLGFVMAQATGVRLLKSKLRFHLSLFALIEVELVRGKNIWRIVNAYPREPGVFYRTSHSSLFARIAGLVRRMVHGEEENQKLFTEMKNIRAMLSQNNLSGDEELSAELVSVARVLESLGYFDVGDYSSILTGSLSKETLADTVLYRSKLASDINLALKESQL